MHRLFEKKLSLKFGTVKSLEAIGPVLGHAPVDRPAQVKGTVKVLDEGVPGRKKPGDTWVVMPNGQWLRIVRDNRIGLEKRLYRIELYDAGQKTRLAVFRRSTEATR